MRIQVRASDYTMNLTDKQRKSHPGSSGNGIAESQGSQDRDGNGREEYRRFSGDSKGGDSKGRENPGHEESPGRSQAPGLRIAVDAFTEEDRLKLTTEVEGFEKESYARALGLSVAVVSQLGATSSGLKVVLKDRTGQLLRSMSPTEFLELRKEVSVQPTQPGLVQRGRLLDRKA